MNYTLEASERRRPSTVIVKHAGPVIALHMKTTHKILGAIWMAICAGFFAPLVQGISETHPQRTGTLAINLFFVFLYLLGGVTSFYVFTGARWSRMVVGVVALLTVAASLMGLFAFFNARPYSSLGIAFDMFALVSAGVFLFVRRSALTAHEAS